VDTIALWQYNYVHLYYIRNETRVKSRVVVIYSEKRNSMSGGEGRMDVHTFQHYRRPHFPALNMELKGRGRNGNEFFSINKHLEGDVIDP
jgi:hypothetical protein